ncbi:hypothetical protein G7K_6915-t1 [Saitoella complicata NRRL Y-17804]|uniref:SAP domain-containing protein n=1 Tax=Saitoella complicata (strain BCRC 22490 / CBS 7301 / JCM 7358 / NBRC 10748 / NRRL Y-17804) TaxID=698492 RepID=A0A0E9NSK7_SAICN|nr:hypothetical protein G7K_6915-t1 [Saitoella complicata NRRL Y-17804]
MRERSRSITLSLLARDRLRGEQNQQQSHTSQSYTNPFSTASFLSSTQQPLYPRQSSQSARHSPEPPRRIIDKTPFLAPAWGGETLESFKFQLTTDTTGTTGAPSIPTFAPLPEIDDQAYLSGYSFYDDIPPLFDGEAGSAADGPNKMFTGLTTIGDGGVEQSPSQAPMAKKRRIATPEIEGPVMGFEEFLFGRTGADGMEVKVATTAVAGDGARVLSPDMATRDPSPTSSSPARTGSMAQPGTTSSTASTTPYLATLSYSGTGTVTPLAPGDPSSTGIPPIGAGNGDAAAEDPLGAALANIDWSNGQGIDQWPDFLHHFPLDPLFVQPGYDQWGLLAGHQQSLDQPGESPKDGTQEGGLGQMPAPIVAQRVQPSITISHAQQPQFLSIHNPQPQHRLSLVAQQRLQQQQRSYTAQQPGRQAPMASLFEYAPFVDPMNTPTVTPPQGVSPPSTATPPPTTVNVPGAGVGVGVGVGVRAQQLQPRQGQMAVVIPANSPVGGQGMTRIPSAGGTAPPRPGVGVAQQGQQGTQTQQHIAQPRVQAQVPPAQQQFPLQPLQPGQQQQRPGPPQQRPSYPLPLPRAIPPPAAKIALAPLPAQPTPPPITPLSSVDLDDITVAECKRLLRQRTLCAVGRKEVLVGRLREWAGEGKV